MFHVIANVNIAADAVIYIGSSWGINILYYSHSQIRVLH